MKIESETLDILKNFSQINPSILVSKGNVVKTVSLTGSVQAKATLKQEFESQMAIYDLPNFISALSMFENPMLDLTDERFVTLSNSEQSAMITYYFADSDMILKPKGTPPDTTKTSIKFRITKEMLADIIKAASILSLPEVGIVAADGKVSINAINPKITSSNLFTKIIGATALTFSIFFKIENLKLISDDYDVSILPPPTGKQNGLAHFKSSAVEYWIACESHSSF
jgi:hypothetical protein